ncbi:uncharacterized protein Dwil_GK27031 [Drosophila willistoni]|nr:uncharacterized protein Dwil_GK27031 [Drosophila willistoni]
MLIVIILGALAALLAFLFNLLFGRGQNRARITTTTTTTLESTTTTNTINTHTL